ncbi:hypothetical protein BDA96_02G106000 [Sorghum bicolor]|uniref:Uncharacterized protein n=2 Tax=Sorghum bicolor TaxID=4558 RepID=A0A921USD2_SORBI|nr:hypothetical protein BDA96_02G106000 [Sorghum bicolor]OQU88826.1 hypothetical protein SORBI_3002G101550 [Sorghum bicolor]
MDTFMNLQQVICSAFLSPLKLLKLRDGTDQSPQKYGIHIPSGNKSYEEFEIMLHF